MKRSSAPRSLAFLSLSLTLVCAASIKPAQAQYYFGNLPYALGSSLLYPLGRVFFGGGTSIYNMANPYYLTNRLVNGTINSSGFFRAPGYGPMPMGLAGYTDEEPLNSPRQRNRPFRYGQWGADQTAYANGYIAPDPDAVVPQAVGQPGAPGMPAVLPGSQSMPGSFSSYGAPQPAPGSLQTGYPAAMPQQATGMPPVAPQRVNRSKRKNAQSPQQIAQQTPAATPAIVASALGPAAPAPFAQGFVSLVNSRFDGDISKTLFSPEGRSWARAVGLVDSNQIFAADLSSERVLVINKIFKDPGLDAVSKLEAAKILLRNPAPSPPVSTPAATDSTELQAGN